MISQMITKGNLSITNYHINSQTAVLELGGFIDTTNAEDLNAILETTLKSSCSEIIINCKRLVYINSTGWRYLISKMTEQNIEIKFVAMQSLVLEVFELLDLHHIFGSFEKLEDVFSDFGGSFKEK